MKIGFFRGRTALSLFLLFAAGCGGSGEGYYYPDPFDLGDPQGGVVIADFQSLDDYLDHPTVQLLLDNMPGHLGNNPPAIAGTYSATGYVLDSTIPGSLSGNSLDSYFCFGLSSGGELDVQVIDPSVDETQARSFIEGSGDQFTVYTAFRSVQVHPEGGNCEITKVNVFSGTRESDGSLSDLHIGCAIVGLIGECDLFRIDQAQISYLSSILTGEGCSSLPQGPDDEGKVQVIIENFLLDSVNIFTEPNLSAIASVDARGTASMELDPGFTLRFESARPDNDAGGPMGEVVEGAWGQETAGAGETVTYIIVNMVDQIEFYAPRLLNSSSSGVYTVVNSGVPALDFPPYDGVAPGEGLDCLCEIPQSTEPYFLGYYSHDAPEIAAADANVRVFDFTTRTELLVDPPFLGPFDLEPGSGEVVLEITD